MFFLSLIYGQLVIVFLLPIASSVEFTNGEWEVLARRLRVIASLVVQYKYPSICLSSHPLWSPVSLVSIILRFVIRSVST